MRHDLRQTGNHPFFRADLTAGTRTRRRAVIDDAVGQLPSRAERAATADDSAESVVVPQQRKP